MTARLRRASPGERRGAARRRLARGGRAAPSERRCPRGRVVVSCTAAARRAAASVATCRRSSTRSTRRAAAGACAICAAPSAAAARPRGTRSGCPACDGRCARCRHCPARPACVRARRCAEFDAYAAARLPAAEHLIAFNGQALAQFARRGAPAIQSVSLVSANPHLRRLARQHALARRALPARGLMGHAPAAAQPRRVRAGRAHLRRLQLHARVVPARRASPRSSSSHFPLTPDPRYAPAPRPPPARATLRDRLRRQPDGHKGVPLLIDAVRRLPHPDLRLRARRRLGHAGHAALHAARLRRRPAHRASARAIRCRTCARRACASTRPTRTASPTRPPRRSPAACR